MKQFLVSLRGIFIFIGILWIIYFLSLPFPVLKSFGIIPRTTHGLIGIMTSPFLHANFVHLYMNSIGFLTFSIIIFFFYRKKGFDIILIVQLIGGVLTWIFGRSANHIGASGLIFGMYGYLISHGFYEKNTKSSLITLAVIILYGPMIYGIIPQYYSHISWEGHLFSFIGGVAITKYKLT